MPQPKTLAERLRSSLEASRAQRSEDFQIPGYDPPLYVTMRQLKDYAEVRQRMSDLRLDPRKVDVAAELEVACRTLAMASIDVAVHENGEKHSLGMPLGLALYESVFGPQEVGPQSDEEAVMLLLPDTAALMNLFLRYSEWTEGNDAATENELAGE